MQPPPVHQGTALEVCCFPTGKLSHFSAIKAGKVAQMHMISYDAEELMWILLYADDFSLVCDGMKSLTNAAPLMNSTFVQALTISTKKIKVLIAAQGAEVQSPSIASMISIFSNDHARCLHFSISASNQPFCLLGTDGKGPLHRDKRSVVVSQSRQVLGKQLHL